MVSGLHVARRVRGIWARKWTCGNRSYCRYVHALKLRRAIYGEARLLAALGGGALASATATAGAGRIVRGAALAIVVVGASVGIGVVV